MNADKPFASRAKRKERNKRNRKEKCACMREHTLPRQAQVVLTATMHAVGIRCVNLGHVALQLHFTCSAKFVSFVRGTCVLRLCCRFHRQGKWFPSLRLLKSKSPVISTWLSKESCTSWGVFRLLGSLKRAPSAALRLPTVACIAAR